MKKVISALTAATMVASMTAGVMSAYAAYDAASVRYYLATGDDKATRIEVKDTSKDTTITIQSYIDCDTDVAPTQILTAGVGLDMPDGITFTSGTSSNADGAEERTYNLSNGASFTSKRFVNCFDGYNVRLEEVTNNCASSGDWGISVDGVPVWNWATTNQELTFITDQSDELPLTEFTVTVPAGTKPGTYTIGYADTYHTSRDEVDATYIGGKGSLQTISVKDGFTIKVGDGGSDPDPTDAPKPTEAPTEAPTESQGPSTTPSKDHTAADKAENSQDVQNGEYTWIIEDAKYDDKKGAVIGLYVYNDIGIFGYKFDLLIDGKKMNKEDGFICDVMKQPEGSYKFETFAPNYANFGVGAVTGKTESGDTLGEAGDRKLDNGTKFIEIYVYSDQGKELFKDDNGGYTKQLPVTIVPEGFEITQVDGAAESPKVIDGVIYYEDAADPEPTGDVEPTTDAEEPSTTQGEQPTTDGNEPTPGTARYGDTDVNGEVQLRDVVMLNRFLTGYQNQQLSAQGVINANVSRSGESDADTTIDNLTVDDSLTILKVLVGNVAEKDLPVQQK